MNKKVKTFIIYVLPYIYMGFMLWLRRSQLSHNNTVLTIYQFEFLAWLFNLMCIIVVQILVTRNKRMLRQHTGYS